MTPEGWRVAPLSECAERITSGGTPSVGRPDYYGGPHPFAKIEDVTRSRGRVLRSTGATITDLALTETSAKLYPAGTVLVTMYGTIGAVAITGAELAANQAIAAFVGLRDTEAGFLVHLLEREAPRLASKAGQTTQANISGAILKSHQVLLPPLAEQKKIATILSSVDDAIESAQAVIDQLDVVKTAMMAELLTRGIPGRHTRFKMTEIGEVPENWEVVPLGSMSEFVTSGSRGWAEYYASDGALFLRSQNVRSGYIDLSDRAFVRPPEGAEGARTRLAAGDVLVTITGNSVGNVAVAPGSLGEAYVSQHVGLVRLRQSSLAPFCAMYLGPGAPGNGQVIAAQYGQSKPGLNLANLKSFQIPLPPEGERLAIQSAVGGVSARLEVELEALGSLLLARTAVMSVLLTGEVRVKPYEMAT